MILKELLPWRSGAGGAQSGCESSGEQCALQVPGHPCVGRAHYSWDLQQCSGVGCNRVQCSSLGVPAPWQDKQAGNCIHTCVSTVYSMCLELSIATSQFKYRKGKGKLLPKIEDISRGKAHTNTQKLIKTILMTTDVFPNQKSKMYVNTR